MSVQAITWAYKQEIRPSSVKFLLVTLANIANEQGEAYPSLAHLVQATCQDRKTVIAGLDRLEKAGLIADSGDRRGASKQVKVYQLSINRETKSTENGTLSDAETVPFLDGDSTVFPRRESQKRYSDTKGKQQDTTIKEKRAHRLPEDWRPTEDQINYARQQGCPNPQRTALDFKEYWISHGKRMVDWNLTWRGWCRREQQFRGGSRPAQTRMQI